MKRKWKLLSIAVVALLVSISCVMAAINYYITVPSSVTVSDGLVIDSSELAFDNIQKGEQSTQTVTVTNKHTVDVMLTVSCVGPDVALLKITANPELDEPFSLAKDTPKTIEFTFFVSETGDSRDYTWNTIFTVTEVSP